MRLGPSWSQGAQALLVGLGGNIQARRLSFGMTLDDLAVSTRLSVTYLRRLEAGKANPPLDRLVLVAEALQIDAASLLADPVAPETNPTSKSA